VACPRCLGSGSAIDIQASGGKPPFPTYEVITGGPIEIKNLAVALSNTFVARAVAGSLATKRAGVGDEQDYGSPQSQLEIPRGW